MIGQQVPYTISQNVSFATNPTDFCDCAHDRRSVSGDRAGQAAHDRGAAGGQPARARAFVRERNAVRRAVAPRHRAPAVRRDGGRARPTRAAPASTSCSATTRTRCSRGSASQESRRLIQPLNRLEQHAAVRSAEPLDVSQRPAEGHPAFQRRAAVPRQLHLRQVARLRRVGGERRRRGRQSRRPSRTSRPGHGPSGFDVRHRAVVSWVWELPWGPNRRWMREGGVLGAIVGGWQLCRHRDDDDRPAVHGVHADRREQRRAELAEPDRIGRAGQPDA